jgi:hypothetical protein
VTRHCSDTIPAFLEGPRKIVEKVSWSSAVKDMNQLCVCGSVHPIPHMPSWHSAQLVKHGDNFTLPYQLCVFIEMLDYDTSKIAIEIF